MYFAGTCLFITLFLFSDQFMCLNGDCVHEDFKCDGNNNCGDNSDEQDCREC